MKRTSKMATNMNIDTQVWTARNVKARALMVKESPAGVRV